MVIVIHAIVSDFSVQLPGITAEAAFRSRSQLEM